VKELRLREISELDAANAFAPEFIADYNRRFARAPRSEHDAHRPPGRSGLLGVPELVLQLAELPSNSLPRARNRSRYSLTGGKGLFACRNR